MLRGGFCYNFVIDCLPTNFSSKKQQNYNDLQDDPPTPKERQNYNGLQGHQTMTELQVFT